MADPTMATPLFGVPTGGAQVNAPIMKPQKYVEQDPHHQGFQGVARDVLGTLGDFLLTRLHMPAMYAPAQQRRKMAAAMEGLDTDPVAAIQRVTSIDPTAGLKLRDQYIDNERLAAAQASTKEARDARIQQAQTVQNDRTRSRVGAMLDTMTTWDDDKRTSNYPHMRDQALKYAKAQGLDLAGELPETFDPSGLDSFIDGSVPVGTQRAQRLQAKRDEVVATDKVADNERQAAADKARVDHNKVTESQGAQRIGIAAQRANRAPAAKDPKNVQSYVGDDNYKYTQRSDGSVVKSTTTVKPTGKAAAPPEGTRRVVNGHTYEIRNGKPVRVK